MQIKQKLQANKKMFANCSIVKALSKCYALNFEKGNKKMQKNLNKLGKLPAIKVLKKKTFQTTLLLA